MWLLSLLSAILFVVPVFVTFGGYFAAEYEKILKCGFGCGQPGAGGFLGTPGGSDIVGSLYCEKFYGITPAPGNYLFNPNVWGDPENTGSLCLNFTSNDTPDNYALGWSAIWNFTIQGPTDNPVHAFPNAQINAPNVLPKQLSGINGLTVDIAWAYDLGDGTSTATDFAALTAADLNANVCVDMFLAQDQAVASSTTKSDYEVMVWLARLGPDVDPLGFENGALDTRTVNGVSFSLYSEANAFGQTTFTWLAADTTTEFTGDIGTLLQGLDAFNGPKTDDYLGYVAFGSETFHANKNATFYVPRLEMEVHES